MGSEHSAVFLLVRTLECSSTQLKQQKQVDRRRAAIEPTETRATHSRETSTTRFPVLVRTICIAAFHSHHQSIVLNVFANRTDRQLPLAPYSQQLALQFTSWSEDIKCPTSWVLLQNRSNEFYWRAANEPRINKNNSTNKKNDRNRQKARLWPPQETLLVYCRFVLSRSDIRKTTSPKTSHKMETEKKNNKIIYIYTKATS